MVWAESRGLMSHAGLERRVYAPTERRIEGGVGKRGSGGKAKRAEGSGREKPRALSVFLKSGKGLQGGSKEREGGRSSTR